MTFRRLLRLWRAEWRLGALGLSLAFAYTMISIAIPLLMQRAVDHAIVSHTKPLWPYIVAIVGLAAVQFDAAPHHIGSVVSVRIQQAGTNSLFGQLVSEAAAA